VSEQATREEKVVVFVVTKHASRRIFLERESTAKLGIHLQHVM
jgi:hypothetical protein